MKNPEHKNERCAVAPGLLGIAALAAYMLVLRPWHLRWGATDDEVAERLPGDEIVPFPRMTCTHAITIEAPAARVWPWLVQIGQDKAGFYSYRCLENLFLCRMPSVKHVIPEFQQIRVGDKMRLHPQVPPLPVERVETGRAIVLGTNSKDPGTWTFYLKPLGEDSTRLILRGRGDFKPGLLKWVTRYVFFEPAHFIMERKMMLGIKALAESSPTAGEYL